jgi:hypothetical protein
MLLAHVHSTVRATLQSGENLLLQNYFQASLPDGKSENQGSMNATTKKLQWHKISHSIEIKLSKPAE